MVMRHLHIICGVGHVGRWEVFSTFFFLFFFFSGHHTKG